MASSGILRESGVLPSSPKPSLGGSDAEVQAKVALLKPGPLDDAGTVPVSAQSPPLAQASAP
jgi:hypothetical protein